MSEAAFENGQRVLVTHFDYEDFDVEIIARATQQVRRDTYLESWRCAMRVIDLVCADRNVELAKDCLYFAMGATPLSEVEIARKFDITKQAVSKRIVKFTQALEIMPSAGMRSMQSRETFSKIQTCNHAKRKIPMNHKPLINLPNPSPLCLALTPSLSPEERVESPGGLPTNGSH